MFMGHKKWSNDEELMLIKKISMGNKLENIAKEHDRTIPAVLKRLEKITYENIESGKSITEISNKLHLKPDVIHKLYNSHKKSNSRKLRSFNEHANLDSKYVEHVEHVEHVGGAKINDKLKKLILENKVISELILNKNLTKQLNDLITSGKIDSNIKQIIKYIRNN